MEKWKKEEWKRNWGREYDRPIKKGWLSPLFNEMESKGEFGEVIVDVGSGEDPVSDFIPGKHKVITIDLHGEEGSYCNNEVHVNTDIERAADEDTYSAKKLILKISKFLGINLRGEQSKEKVNSMVFSEILNYVNYQEVLRSCAQYLKPGGRFVILNMPTRGHKKLYSKKGLKNNSDLYNFLKDGNFEIEKKMFPWAADEKDLEKEEGEMILLVARKKET